MSVASGLVSCQTNVKTFSSACMRLLVRAYSFLRKFRRMSIFTQARNPITGKAEWVSQSEDYDYHQEVARAAFGDMLHDWERNQKYYKALKKAVNTFHENGKEAHVLDIGTGTGILSMMAVRAGADSVTACEAFMPMANCADKIIKANGMGDRIKLVRKRSQDLSVGEDGDLRCLANVLVTEVFDTELIGEGAVSVFNHANKCLLTEDAIVIPSFATVYIQVVESPLVYAWNKQKILANLDGDILLEPPKEMNDCCGEAAVHDIQLSQLDENLFKNLTEPTPIFGFDWCTKKPIPNDRKEVRKILVKRNGVAQVVFFWWELKMDMDGDIILSCAPSWAHPDFKSLAAVHDGKTPIQNVVPWRDHWMQAVYYLPKPVNVFMDQEVTISGYHDEYSFWFVAGCENENIPRISCKCEIHNTYPRTRIGQVNNSMRNKKFIGIFEDFINSNSKVLSLSCGSLLCICPTKLGAASVTVLEEHSSCARILGAHIKYNNLSSKVNLVSSIEEAGDLSQITHVIAEPYFISSILPWDNFYFGTVLTKIRAKLRNDVEILPVSATIYAMPVEFLDLHKIKAPLGICEGFDLSIFDKFIEKSSELADATVDAQPLWEYPCKAAALPQDIISVDFRKFGESKHNSGAIQIEKENPCNGVALWVDWKLRDSGNPKHIVSTGPQTPITVGKWVHWDMNTKQGVHLFTHPKHWSHAINWQCSFNPTGGEINFKFERD